MTTKIEVVDEAITTRMSARAFTNQEVPRSLLEEILMVASKAPSGTNTQPWKVYVLQGQTKDQLCDKVCALHDAIRDDPNRAQEYKEAYPYYPQKWVSPYIERRRENGWSLYGLLGIGKADKDKMHAQQQRNYRYFDAPIGLVFTMDDVMERGTLLDYGMFLQNIMIAARARGLHTCPQAAWNSFAKIILPHIGAAPSELMVCSMALGWRDESHVSNQLITPRETVESFTHWVGK